MNPEKLPSHRGGRGRIPFSSTQNRRPAVVRRLLRAEAREPVGERGDEAAELIRSLDDERQVERRGHRRQPVEPLRMQLDAEPALGLQIGVSRRRGLLHARDAGGKPDADLLGCPLDPQDYLMPVRSLGEPGQDALRRIDSGGRLDEPGRVSGVGDAV